MFQICQNDNLGRVFINKSIYKNEDAGMLNSGIPENVP